MLLRDSLSFQFCPVCLWQRGGSLCLAPILFSAFLWDTLCRQAFWLSLRSISFFFSFDAFLWVPAVPFLPTCCFWMLKGFLWTSLPNPTLAAGLERWCLTAWWCLRFLRCYSEALKSFLMHDLILCQSVNNTVLGVTQKEACFKFMQFKKVLGNRANGALCNLHVSLM